MSVFTRAGTIQPESHITGNMSGIGTAGSDDSGCTGNGQYTVIRYVYLSGESSGSSGDCRGTGSTDTAAVYAGNSRCMDTDNTNDNDRWKTLSDK